MAFAQYKDAIYKRLMLQSTQELAAKNEKEASCMSEFLNLRKIRSKHAHDIFVTKTDPAHI